MHNSKSRNDRENEQAEKEQNAEKKNIKPGKIPPEKLPKPYLRYLKKIGFSIWLSVMIIGGILAFITSLLLLWKKITIYFFPASSFF